MGDLEPDSNPKLIHMFPRFHRESLVNRVRQDLRVRQDNLGCLATEDLRVKLEHRASRARPDSPVSQDLLAWPAHLAQR